MPGDTRLGCLYGVPGRDPFLGLGWPGPFVGDFFSFGGFMRPSSRKHVNKGRSARQFRGNTKRTKSPNLRTMPMRGGWRL